jgi:type I restriction enzyme M protein
MSITSSLKSKIDALWLDFHSGGITNPITVIEQISYLMFARLLDITESRNEKRAARLKKGLQAHLPQRTPAPPLVPLPQRRRRRMLTIVRDEFFPFMRTNLQQHRPRPLPQGRQLPHPFRQPALPRRERHRGPPAHRRRHQGRPLRIPAGQAHHRRHRRASSAPRATSSAPWWRCSTQKPTETVCDPACGTGGFLIGTMEYLCEKYSSPPSSRPTRRATNTSPATCSNPTAPTSRATCSTASTSTPPCSASPP